MTNFTYKSLCWSFGTTSFRTKNFNRTIEEQLRLLNEFWKLNINKEKWTANENLQNKYYDYMKKEEFIKGEAKNKAKDAREKTSGLVDLGLINDERKITPAGLALLKICDNGNFQDNNEFNVDADSYIYLKQLLKVYYSINGNVVRPFIVLLKFLTEFEYITDEEFRYLIPLCITENNTKLIINKLIDLRNNVYTIDEILIEQIMDKDNYKSALEYFISSEVSEDVITMIGMNRKSRSYDKPYFELYNNIKKVYLENSEDSIINLFYSIQKIKIGSYWRNFFFNVCTIQSVKKDPKKYLKENEFQKIKNETELKVYFFKLMHLFKVKANLSDYEDLNKRYIKTADIILFRDGRVELDFIAKAFFKECIVNLYNECFKKSIFLFDDVSLSDISSSMVIVQNKLFETISEILNKNITSLNHVKKVAKEERHNRFLNLLKEKFNDEKLIYLLNCFEKRKDVEIQEYVTDNADIPTIFEYILGIIWFKISEYKGDILDFFNLSLDSNLLPKSHATGGNADIVYDYEKTNDFPQHQVLLEATLTESTNQRRMEMEPVSRHLGKFLIKTGNPKSYCVFISNYLDINVISDFRSRKNMLFYDSVDHEKYVEEMKIIPLETDLLKEIIKKNITYPILHKIFENAYYSNLQPHVWYKSEIKNKILEFGIKD